jgi:hypothetical protein
MIAGWRRQREEELLRKLPADVRDPQLGSVEFRHAAPDPDDAKAGVGPVE